MKYTLYFISLLFLYCAGPTAYCQQHRADTSLNLREVVVTGSRTERPVSQSPGSIAVVTPVALKNNPAQTVDEILSMISGINTTRANGISEIRTNVSIRGLAGDEQGRTLVLLDGIPLNTSDEGSVNWNSIDIDNLQRIEVFKGPGSSLYGNNALGGVINLISKKSTDPFSVRGSVSYGSLGTWMTRLGFSGQPGKHLSVFLSGFYNRSDGFNNIPDSLRTVPDYSLPRFVKEGGVYGKLLYTPSALFNTELAYDLYRDKRGEGEKIEAPDGEYRRFDHHRIRARLFGEKKRFSYNAAFYFQRQNYFRLDERIKNETYQRFDVKSERQERGGILNIRFSGRCNDLSIGGEYKDGSVDGGDYYVTSPDRVLNRGTMTFASVYIQDELSFLEKKFWLQLALRYDNAWFHKGNFEATGELVTDFDTYNGKLKNNRWEHFSPRAALRFNPVKQISLYLSYSQGFRASILDDLCRSGWMWIGPKIANPGLGPETLDNYEIGGTFTLFPGFSLSPALYYAKGKDFLYYIATGEKLWGKMDIYQRRNITEIEMKGAEIDLHYRPLSGLNLSASYTYNEPRIKAFTERPELNDKILTYAPKHMVKGSLLWTGGLADIMLRAQYKSKQYTTEDNSASIAGFTVWDIRLSRWFFGHRLYAGGEILNIFDNRHMNTKDYISAGRLMNIKLAFHFSKTGSR